MLLILTVVIHFPNYIIGEMSINNTRIPSKYATTLIRNVNLSFEIGTRQMYATDTNETLLEDANDGVDSRVQKDTHETVNECVKDGVEAHAMNDD